MTPAPRFTHAEADRQNAERRRRNARREPVVFDLVGAPVVGRDWTRATRDMLLLVGPVLFVIVGLLAVAE